MHTLHMLHVLHLLMVGFRHIHSSGTLYHYYVHHHAVQFLRSGFTSESPATRGQAIHLLHWLVSHRVNPVDW